MPITGPCRVCGIYISAPDLSSLLCGPACRSLHAKRQASTERGARPGDVDYHPTNDVQKALHHKRRRSITWA